MSKSFLVTMKWSFFQNLCLIALAHLLRSQVLLVRIETSPEDIGGLHAAEGALTTRCGVTSHAAVVARTMGRPCVAGARELRVDYAVPWDENMGKSWRKKWGKIEDWMENVNSYGKCR